MTGDINDNDYNDYRRDAADARAARNTSRCQCSGEMPGTCPGPANCPCCETDEEVEVAAHTPGPWVFVQDGHGYSTLWNPETRQEVMTTGGYNDGDGPIVWMGEELSDADLRLIEAAPALFAALENIMNARWHPAGIGEDFADAARAALAKVRGDAP